MKQTFLGLCILFSIILFWGCKEEHNLVDITNSSTPSTDTTFVLPSSAIPSADPHQIFFEDYTGVSCPNCPGAHDHVLVPLDENNKGRINIIEYFIPNYPQTGPNQGYQQLHDFRDSIAGIIGTQIYQGIAGLPTAGIDRMPYGDNSTSILQISSGKWTSSVMGLLPIKDSLNLKVTSTYNATTNSAIIVAQVTYLFPNPKAQNLSLAIVEDSLQDYQAFVDSVAMYHYNGVFRAMVTAAPYGDPIYPTITNKEAGRVCQKVYNYTFKSGVIAKNCRVIAFVNNAQSGGGAPVYQSCQARIAP